MRLVVAALVATFASAQTPTFEVATIKTPAPGTNGMFIRFPGGRLSAENFTLDDLISYAYEVDKRQIVGGPKWVDSEHYNVIGQPEKTGPVNQPVLKLMLQSLLAERFQLKTHRDTREMPVFVLTVAKSGSKLRPRTEGDGGTSTRMIFEGKKVPARNVTMQFFTYGLQGLRLLDRPIVDQTGLTGRFDFDLSWSEQRPDGTKVGDADAPDFFTAVREQMGLDLESRRVAAPVIVIDSAQKPSEN